MDQRRNGIDGKPGVVRCHIGTRDHLVNCRTVVTKLGEGILAEVDRNMAIFEAEPCKSGSQKMVNISHEIEPDLISNGSFE